MHSIDIPWGMGIPFVLLLLAIALLPLVRPDFWHPNRNKAWLTLALILPVALFFGAGHAGELFAALEEYFSFIVMIGALFVISGGIVCYGDLQATPRVNTLLLLVGALLANLIGTTGASMLLVRPLLRTNRERKHTKHIPVFFIFLVANIGGSLTPLGDPPLFLGYLRGVPFQWNLSLLPQWLIATGILLAVFYLWDRRCYAREDSQALQADRNQIEPLRLAGRINLLFMLGVVAAVAFQTPAPYRELVMLSMTLLSLACTKKGLRADNGFTWHPLLEVVILFLGIFITMRPLLLVLEAHGPALGIVRPWQYFWLTGGLSAFLDNAPTYLTFFSLAESVTRSLGAAGTVLVAGVRHDLLSAISCGAVFMGALTYIGNGPNFMIQSIAREQGQSIPNFFEYMAYSGAILLPLLGLLTLLFFV